MADQVGNQSPLPLIDLKHLARLNGLRWESVTSPFDRLNSRNNTTLSRLGISHLSL